MTDRSSPEVICIGELLWDSLPLGLFLGGAPFNVAYHLHRAGVRAAPVSRIGDDRLGHEAVRRTEWMGIPTDLIQRDSDHPTGFVEVSVDKDGIPDYTIVQPTAWDFIRLEDHLIERGARARALVFGSLAQRSSESRATIRRLCRTDTFLVFDVNLRPPFDSKTITAESLEYSDLAKLNVEELAQLSSWFGWEGDRKRCIQQLIDRFDCRTVCLTRGSKGALLARNGEWVEHEGFQVDVRDTVGSGDAFLATLLAGLLEEAPLDELLIQANRVAAYVATRIGATPNYSPDSISSVR